MKIIRKKISQSCTFAALEVGDVFLMDSNEAVFMKIHTAQAFNAVRLDEAIILVLTPNDRVEKLNRAALVLDAQTEDST